MSGFRCTIIHPYNPDTISPQVYAPNERFKGCVIDANEGVNNREEENNEDEDNNQDNNDNDDNDGIDTEHNIERECGNGDEDNITDTDHVPSIVEALQESEVRASKRIIESVVVDTLENTPSTSASAKGTVSSSSGSTPGSLRDFFVKLFQTQTPRRVTKQPMKCLIGFGVSLTNEEALERA